MTKPVKRNDRGWRTGESHPQAKFTDHEIELMHRLHNNGTGLTVTELAEKFETSKGYMSDLLRGNRR